MKNMRVITAISVLGMAVCLFMGCSRGNVLTDAKEAARETAESDAEAASPAEETAGGDAGGTAALEDLVAYYDGCASGTTVAEELNEEEASAFFHSEEISGEIYDRIYGISYVENDDIGLEDLRYLRLLYVGFDGETHVGELIANVSIADELLEIFFILYENDYQIEKMKLIDDYDGDDDASCLDDNTSCFNYRVVEGSSSLSCHAFGLAVDINPFYNPYVTYPGGVENISPEGSEAYADRTSGLPHMIGTDGDLCLQLFEEYGYTWGGNWNSLKDYQHFQKDPAGFGYTR